MHGAGTGSPVPLNRGGSQGLLAPPTVRGPVHFSVQAVRPALSGLTPITGATAYSPKAERATETPPGRKSPAWCYTLLRVVWRARVARTLRGGRGLFELASRYAARAPNLKPTPPSLLPKRGVRGHATRGSVARTRWESLFLAGVLLRRFGATWDALRNAVIVETVWRRFGFEPRWASG